MMRYGLGILAVSMLAGCVDDNENAGAADMAANDDMNTTPPLTLFLSADGYASGGGFAGADAHCMADPNYPGSGTFKALLGGAARSVCPEADCASGAQPVDWVLAADTPYTLLDGTTLFTTNSDAVFLDWPMATTLGQEINFFSGLDRDWTVRDGLHCDDWTLQGDEHRAGVGWAASADSGFLQGGDLGCARQLIVCVEQP